MMPKMNLLSKPFYFTLVVFFASFLIFVGITYAGLNPSASPDNTMFTLEDIYVRLQPSGTSASYGLNPLTFPSVTMFTLTQLYNATPDFNSSPGTAVAGDVCNSATFYNNSSTRVTGTRTGCGGGGFPDTGQTTCYNMTASTACGTSLFPRQDADYTIHAPSYSTISSVTVLDNNTLLEWQRHGHGSSDGTTPPTAVGNCAVGATYSSSYCSYNWQDALKYCSNLTLDGNADWRLPNATELVSIADLGTYSPSINTTYFLNTQSGYYWSSSTYLTNGSIAWNVSFSVGTIFSSNKTITYGVRCVRGGT